MIEENSSEEKVHIDDGAFGDIEAVDFPADDVESLRLQLEEVRNEASQFREAMQRAQADLVNYKRRVDEERIGLQQRANESIILNLLAVLDDYKRALQYIPDNLDDLGSWVSGVELVYRNLERILESFGLLQIQSYGNDFDPSQHEALLHQPTSEMEDGKIISIVREGYKLNGRVIRPAQVVVSKSENNIEDEIEESSEKESE
jgi:molecular chaperone GrpE